MENTALSFECLTLTCDVHLVHIYIVIKNKNIIYVYLESDINTTQ